MTGQQPTAQAAATRAEPTLAKLELTVRRRLDGLLQGNYLGLVPGPGSEAGEARIYHPGDDVRRMDWPITARTTVPHVRQTVADRELETWIVVDLSPSLDFGTAACEKRDLAIAATAAVVFLTGHGGNRVGSVITTGDQVIRIPARAGRAHGRVLLSMLLDTPRAAAGRRGDLAAALRALQRPPRRRGLAVVISDFLGAEAAEASGPDGRGELGFGSRPQLGFERPMRALAARHDVLAVEVLDPRELELPAVGLLTLVDPETGQSVEVQTSRRPLRERYAAAARQQRADIDRALRRTGAAHLQLRTDRDWLVDILRFVVARRRGASAGGLAGVVR